MKNVTEHQVELAYDALVPSLTGVCTCPICREDVLVYALNRLPSHYVSTLLGEVVSKFGLEAGQGPIDVTVALMESIRKVSAAPRCGKKPVTMP